MAVKLKGKTVIRDKTEEERRKLEKEVQQMRAAAHPADNLNSVMRGREARQQAAQAEQDRVSQIFSGVQQRWNERRAQSGYERLTAEARNRLPGDMKTYMYNYAPPEVRTQGNFRGGITSVYQPSSGKMYQAAQDARRIQWERNHPNPIKAEQEQMAQDDPEGFREYQALMDRYNEYRRNLSAQRTFKAQADEAQKALDELDSRAKVEAAGEDGTNYRVQNRSSRYYQDAQYKDALDEQLYDSIVGKGEYQKRKAGLTDDPEGWEKADELELLMGQAWEAYENNDPGEAYRILNGSEGYDRTKAELDMATRKEEAAAEKLKEYKDLEDKPYLQYGMTEEQYLRELKNQLDAGAFDKQTAKEIQDYLFYHNAPDIRNSREYSGYMAGGIEQGMFDDTDERTMWSSEKLKGENAALQEKIDRVMTNRQTEDEINAELYDIKSKTNVYMQMQEQGVYDPDTDTHYFRKPELAEVEDRLSGTVWYNPEAVDTHYDALIYNTVHGEGAYENILENGTDEEYDAMEAEIRDLWTRMENGTIGELAGADAGLAERENFLKAASRATGGAMMKSWQQEMNKNTEELKRRETIGQYSGAAGGLAGYDPSLVDPDLELEYAANMELRGGNTLPGHDRANFMYWMLNKYIPGMERDYGESFTAERWELGQAENQFRKYSFMDEEMLGTYNQLYKDGKTAAAEEYLKALEPFLTQMANSRAQQLRAEAAKGPYGGWYGVGTVIRQPVAGLKGTIGSLAAILGDEGAKDINSFWYKEQRQNTTVRGARAEVWGDFFADHFGEQYRDAGKWWNGVLYSTADNLMAMALTKGAGKLFNFNMASKTATRMIQTIMSSSAASSTMVEKLEQGYEPAEAALYAIGSGYIEAITEKYSIEALFSTNVRDILGDWKAVSRYLLKQFIPESTEEGASNVLNTAWDTLMSRVFGHESELEQEYNALVAGGMGEKEASRQVWSNWKDQLMSEMLAGGVSGLFLGTDVVIGNAVSASQTGRAVNSKVNIVGSQQTGYRTGAQQLVTAAKGMGTGTQSYRLAEEIGQKIKDGKKPSNRQVGTLARLISIESTEQMGEVASGTVERYVRDQLKAQGVNSEVIDRVAGPITKAAVSESKDGLTREEMTAIAEEKRAIDLLGSFLTEEGKQAKREIEAEAAPEAAKAQKAVRDLVTGRNTINLTADSRRISALERYAPIATEAEITDARKGNFINNGLDAVWNGERVQVIGRKGDSYILNTANGTREASRDDVRAAGRNLGILMEYANRNGNAVQDETFDALLEGLKDNPNMDGAEYISGAMDAYVQFRTGGEARNSTLPAKTLQRLRDNAQRMNEKWDTETRLRNESVKPTPGKGVVTFLGSEYGTREWDEKTRKAGHETRRQARLLAEIGTRLGNRMDIVYDTNQPDVFGWDDENGVIVINLAAEGEAGSGMHRHVLTVAAHELTHWLERNSPKQYIALRNYVFDSLRKQGVNVGQLVNSKIENFRAVMDRDMSIEEAMAEIVADASDQVLTSEEVAKTLQDENPNLYQQVKKFARNFVDMIRKNTRDANGRVNIDNSFESRMIAMGGDKAINDLARIWLGARKEAIERQNGQAEAQTETEAVTELTEEVNPHGMEITPEYSNHPASEQFSVRQVARAAKLEIIEGDDTMTMYLQRDDGKTVKALDPTGEKKYVVVDGEKVKITPEMIKDSPVGMLIDMGLKKEQKPAALKMFADLMNLCAKYRDHHLIWEIAGSEFAETFSAMKANADPQYRTTVDFGTICAKTQAIIDVLSETMLERVKAYNEAGKVFGGLTREDVMLVYDRTHNAKLSVPCPVCYVFSRWMGVPSLLGQMNRFQHEYVVTKKVDGQTVYDKNGDAMIDWDATEKTAAKYVREMLDKYGSKKALAEEKTKIQGKIRRREEGLPKLNERLLNQQRRLKNERMTPAKEKNLKEAIKRTQATIDRNIKDQDDLMKAIEQMEGFSWVTRALGTLDENNRYTVDRTFRITPEEILFDLNRTGEFAAYRHNWSYRTSRGAGMGKAIMPYSGADIGDMVRGNASRWTQEQNPFLQMNKKDAEKALKEARKRVKQQNLVGGQRFQSTSDFRPEWGLDYLMSFLEMQALESKVQMYTKVAEAVDFLGSIGADVNQSIMGSGDGWHIATEEEIERAKKDTELRSRMGVTKGTDGNEHTFVMDFSDVTGMDYSTAKENSKKYNSVQMILVGMNDVHIRLAIGNDDIDFVIPWHSSGNSRDVLQQLVASVDETLTESTDYTDSQTDRIKSHDVRKGRTKETIDDRTDAEKNLWNARVKLLSEGAESLTAEERSTLEGNKYTRALLRRFGAGGEYEGMTLPLDQAKQIFPYEYWDVNSTRENADVNGERFAEYCDALGMVPRFSQFKNDRGYWKLLIDRKMYENNTLDENGNIVEYGKYRDQQVVDVTKAEIGQLPESTTAKYRNARGQYAKETQDAIMASSVALSEKYANELRYNPYDGKAKGNTAESGRQMSFRQEYFDINHWMMGLTDSQLLTSQERMLMKQYRSLQMSRQVAMEGIRTNEGKIRQIEAKYPNLTPYDKAMLQKYQVRLNEWQAKRDRYEKELAKATTDKGYAALMYRESRKMYALTNGMTTDGVRRTVDAINAEMDNVAAEMAERSRKLKELAAREGVQRIRQQLDSAGLRRIAAKLKADLGSKLENKEIENRLALVALKMKRGTTNREEIMELADLLVGAMTPDYDSYIMGELRGRTFALTAGQLRELKAHGMTLREVQAELIGTGVRITGSGPNTLEGNWSELAGAIPALSENQNPKDMLYGPDTDHPGIMDLIAGEKRAQQGTIPGSDQVAAMVLEAANDLIPEILTDKKSEQLVRDTMEFIAEVEQSTEALDNISNVIERLKKKGESAKSTVSSLDARLNEAIDYNNQLAAQHDSVNWQKQRAELVRHLQDEHTQAMLKAKQDYEIRLEKDRRVRELMNDNLATRKKIHTNYARIDRLMEQETDRENIPEHMKSLARKMLKMIVDNDLMYGDRKITGMDNKKLLETMRLLKAWNERDGEFTIDDLRMIEDEEAQSVVADALADIEEGIEAYNTETKGKDIFENLMAFRNGLNQILKGVTAITEIISAERNISILDRKILVTDAALDIIGDLDKSRRKGPWKGWGSKAANAVNRSVVYGNTTPVYFFRNLRNRGMDNMWQEMARSENRNGLLLAQARAYMEKLAEDCHYTSWDHEKKYDITLHGKKVKMTLEQMMSMVATWQRELTIGPEMSQHMANGGVYIQDDEANGGKLRRENDTQKAYRVTQEDMDAINNMLTPEQKKYIEQTVKYLSNEMSELGNDASMKMYGIRKYNETYYFPMKVWDGVKSARSDKGISGTDDNRIAHQGWSKRRKHMARNALVIGNFTDTAIQHVVEMINYTTFAPAIEGMNKVLNWQQTDIDDEGYENKRNVRVMFQEAYGKEALRYLEDFMKDLQGGATQDQRKTLRDRMISLFKKNAVAGSASVALQQPLSIIRAATMVNPKYLAESLNPEYWKGSHNEMMMHSGVAVIKEMGRFDMNFGASAREWIFPKAKPGVYETISDKLTEAPQKMDTMTWTRMWTAVKLEQHAEHPEMDVKSEEFLTMVGERFNEVMRRTQVYDSVLVKSSNMRSQNLSMKIITSFMAEPTLSLNVLADALVNFKEEGGKLAAAKAGATFLLSAVMQAIVKGLMGSGRTPDDKKTWWENFLNKFQYNLLSEADPISLIPGYSDLIEVLKNGELKDDAMGVIGKLKTMVTTMQNWGNPDKSKGAWQNIEDTAGQFAQLFTNIPAKNLMRDLRAAYNWVSGTSYADRESSSAVIRYQWNENFMTADNLVGVLNTYLGDAGYKATNTAYYSRMWNAKEAGNEQEAKDIREYLTLGKGVKESTIDSQMKSRTKSEKLAPALEANKSADITAAVKELQVLGVENKDIKSELTKELKPKYLNASGAEKVKIRNAMQIAYKAMGLTAADADKIIDGWVKEAQKNK